MRLRLRACLPAPFSIAAHRVPEALFSDEASHQRVLSTRSALVQTAAGWDLIEKASSDPAAIPVIPKCVVEPFRAGNPSGEQNSKRLVDPLWLAVVSTDVAICRRDHSAAQKFAGDLVSMCEAQLKSSQTGAVGARDAECALHIPRSTGLLEMIRGRALLQQASEQVCIGDLYPARMLLLQFFRLIPADELHATLSAGLPRRLAPHSASASTASDIKLLPCTLPHLVTFALELLVPCYERDTKAMGQSDETLARLIVVYQHEWPRFQMQFHALIELIQSRHQFAFGSVYIIGARLHTLGAPV